MNADGKTCSMPQGGPGQDFGLHTVNTTARPTGEITVEMVEAHFTDKLSTAFKKQTYDSFMDFTTVLFAPDLDYYLEKFQAKAVPYLLLEWSDDKAAPHWSLIVHVAKSQVVLELVTNTKPTVNTNAPVKDASQRIPAEVFTSVNVAKQYQYALSILTVSRAATDLVAINNWYTKYLKATLAHSHTVGTTTVHSYRLSGASAQVRFIQRDASATTGDFSVKDLEDVKNGDHAKFVVDEYCGVDKWFDNHFAYDSMPVKLDTVKEMLDADKQIYHIFGDGSPGTMTNIYACDPTGECVQMDGGWTNTPTGGAGDSLMNACLQGVCAGKPEKETCHTAISKACPNLGETNNVCTDCMYENWDALSKAGCSNADAANYCTNSSLTCSNKCDSSGLCGSPSGQKCSALIKTYSCDKYYCPTCSWAGWCDKECGFKGCQKQVFGL